MADQLGMLFLGILQEIVAGLMDQGQSLRDGRRFLMAVGLPETGKIHPHRPSHITEFSQQPAEVSGAGPNIFMGIKGIDVFQVVSPGQV